MTEDPFDVVLSAAQAGDELAFACLWRNLNPRVLRYLRSMMAANYDDLASETWLQVISHLAAFTGDEHSFRAWVFAIARHKLIDNERRERRRPQMSSDDAAIDAFAAGDDTAVIALENLTTDAALGLIATLPRDQAEVILLRVVAGLDVAAVAQLVGKSAGAVRISAHRGLRRLQEVVADLRAEAGSVL